MAVENFFPAKFAKIKSRQDALQTYKRLSPFPGHFLFPQVLPILRKMDFFNTLVTPTELRVLEFKQRAGREVFSRIWGSEQS
jgi:hypothetical protein